MARQPSDSSSSAAQAHGFSVRQDLRKSYFRVLTAQKTQLEEALKSEEHAKIIYERTAAELHRHLSDLTLAQIGNLVRAKKLQALKEKLRKEKHATVEKQLSTANLEKRVQLQDKLILQLETALASQKFCDTKSSGSTAATTLQASGWKCETTEDARLREIEKRMQRLEEVSSRQGEFTQRLCAEVISLKRASSCLRVPSARRSRTVKRKRRKTKSPTRQEWERNCLACVKD